jgi:hypothetical protein
MITLGELERSICVAQVWLIVFDLAPKLRAD